MSEKTREEKYAEAIDSHTEQAHGYVLSTPDRDALAAAVMAVADAELAEARAEIERLERDAAFLTRSRERLFRERDEARAALARVEAWCAELDARAADVKGRSRDADRTRTVLTGLANQCRDALLPQPVHPAGDGEHVHVCVTCGQVHNGTGWVAP